MVPYQLLRMRKKIKIFFLQKAKAESTYFKLLYLLKINMSGRKVLAQIIQRGGIGHAYAAPFNLQQAFIAHGGKLA